MPRMTLTHGLEVTRRRHPVDQDDRLAIPVPAEERGNVIRLERGLKLVIRRGRVLQRDVAAVAHDKILLRPTAQGNVFNIKNPPYQRIQ